MHYPTEGIKIKLIYLRNKYIYLLPFYLLLYYMLMNHWTYKYALIMLVYSIE